jgi:dCTP deaminase
MRPGVLSTQHIRELLATGAISSDTSIGGSQLQPNSLDLTLGGIAYRTRCSFLPIHSSTSEMLADPRLVMSVVDLAVSSGALLECGVTYLIPLQERLLLPPDIHCKANPKSSTGRLDMLARLITEQGHEFDTISEGYAGPLYLEVVCRSFPIRLRQGDSLAQIRFNRGNPCLSDEELHRFIKRGQIIRDSGGVPISPSDLQIKDGVFLTVRLIGQGDETVGFFAKRNTPSVDFRVHDHSIKTYWERIHSAHRANDLQIIEANEFYIFSSQERLVVPPELCAEMVAYDAKSGELRTHYAGFFDSGFGMGTAGAHVVLEVRNQDIPFLVQHGQRLFRMQFYWNLEEPDVLYGSANTHSHYQGQRLRLAKHFSAAEHVATPQLELWGAVGSRPVVTEPDTIELSRWPEDRLPDQIADGSLLEAEKAAQ